MPRILTATCDDYEEPVSVSRSAAHRTRRSPRTYATTAPPTGAMESALPPVALGDAKAAASAASTQSSATFPPPQEQPALPPQSDPVALDDTQTGRNESTSSMRLYKAQRAEEEYPQLAFHARRNIAGRHNSNGNDSTHPAAMERTRAAGVGAATATRPRDYIFGLGSCGLRDSSHAAGRVREGDGDHSHHCSKPSTSTPTHSKSKTRHAKKEKKKRDAHNHAPPAITNSPSSVPHLPPIAVPGSTATPTSTLVPPSSAAALNAPRRLRCGGVIDIFSYFSVHRVHPELYGLGQR